MRKQRLVRRRCVRNRNNRIRSGQKVIAKHHRFEGDSIPCGEALRLREARPRNRGINSGRTEQELLRWSNTELADRGRYRGREPRWRSRLEERNADYFLRAHE